MSRISINTRMTIKIVDIRVDDSCSNDAKLASAATTAHSASAIVILDNITK